MMVSATHDSEHGKQHSCRAFLLYGSTKQTSTARRTPKRTQSAIHKSGHQLSRGPERDGKHTRRVCVACMYLCVCAGV